MGGKNGHNVKESEVIIFVSSNKRSRQWILFRSIRCTIVTQSWRGLKLVEAWCAVAAAPQLWVKSIRLIVLLVRFVYIERDARIIHKSRVSSHQIRAPMSHTD